MFSTVTARDVCVPETDVSASLMLGLACQCLEIWMRDADLLFREMRTQTRPRRPKIGLPFERERLRPG